MAIRSYTSSFNTRSTPQTEAIPGSPQVQNSAGGFSFQVDMWTKLNRFLILGSEGGSYYATERKLTRDNAGNVLQCLQADGLRTVNRIVEVSLAGTAPKNDPAIFALALALKQGNEQTRKAAQEAVPKVCRIGTHLFQLAEAVKALGGWGRGTKKAFASWYEGKKPDSLAMQLVKYQQRGGWSHADILRKAHPHSEDTTKNALFRYALRGPEGLDAFRVTPREGPVREYGAIHPEHLPRVIDGFERVKGVTDPKEIVRLIAEYGLPRECIPTEALNHAEVWEALLTSGDGMPYTAMIRNLAKMTEVGLLKPLSSTARFIAERLQNQEGLREARVHPLNVLLARKTYGEGRGFKGSLTWSPVPQVLTALENAFYLSFGNVQPTGKNHLLGLDVSGSMGAPLGGTFLQCREAAAAMAMVAARTEQNYMVYGFTNRFVDLHITASDSLSDAIGKAYRSNFGSTDCSLPMEHAIEHKLEVDAFFVYTDSETYAGRRHPSQALQDYRQKSGRPAKLVVVGMVANDFSIADPRDAGMLDVVGFDSSAPAVMADFIR